MRSVVDEILTRIDAAQGQPDFLDILFGHQKQAALSGTKIVLFGAGALGKEMRIALKNQGVEPFCFCDNNSKNGQFISGLPVVDFFELQRSHKDSLILITSQKYREEISRQLLSEGFSPDRLLCLHDNLDTSLLTMYALVGTQNVLFGNRSLRGKLAEKIRADQQKVQKAYDLLSDHKSKALFIAKLTLLVSEGNFSLFRHFILDFSEPVAEFGSLKCEGSTEDYYYFNNDVLTVESGEIYIDVGAFDGDSIHMFVEACRDRNVDYSLIVAFEPDPVCYDDLVKNTSGYDNMKCEKLGLWSKSTILKFIDSDQAIHNQAGSISTQGNVEIKVVSLDDYMHGDCVTFIKMDPSGNVIPEVLIGARNTIAAHKPNLAVGAYHNFDSIYEIPLLLNEICPEYQIFLRHNTYHLCDTDLYAKC